MGHGSGRQFDPGPHPEGKFPFVWHDMHWVIAGREPLATERCQHPPTIQKGFGHSGQHLHHAVKCGTPPGVVYELVSLARARSQASASSSGVELYSDAIAATLSGLGSRS